VRGTMADGATVSVSGTLTGPRHVERIVEVNGYVMEIAPAAHMGFFTYTDRPGMVGVVGRLLGDAGVNIAGMQVGRHEKGGRALIALTVDSALTPDVVDAITEEIGADQGRRVDLDHETRPA
jgi:D-3-phosphoglycerate dehydrogenase